MAPTNKSWYLKRYYLVPLIVILILILATPVGISVYVGTSLVHPVRESIDTTPEAVGLLYENVEFPSQPDNLTLSGWWVGAQKEGKIHESSKTILFVHGYGSSRLIKQANALSLADTLVHAGYNVMMFDLRNSGNSAGNQTTVGTKERQDVLSAIRFAREIKKSSSIGLIGWSMGAATVLVAGTANPDVRLIIADSPFADLRAYLSTNLPYWSGLPDVPFTRLILLIMPLISDVRLEQVSPQQAVQDLGSTPLLLIHTRQDKAIPYQNSEQIYNAIRDKSHTELWLPERGDHVKALIEYPEEYKHRVLSFLEQYM